MIKLAWGDHPFFHNRNQSLKHLLNCTDPKWKWVFSKLISTFVFYCCRFNRKFYWFKSNVFKFYQTPKLGFVLPLSGSVKLFRYLVSSASITRQSQNKGGGKRQLKCFQNMFSSLHSKTVGFTWHRPHITCLHFLKIAFILVL